MKIEIAFTRPKNKIFPIGSWAIRLYQNTKFSHVAIIFTLKSGKRLVYESVGSGGVRYISEKVWLEHVKVIDTFDMELMDETHKIVMDFCIDHAGEEYGFMQNIGILIANIFSLKSNPFKKGVNCSELLADILEINGTKINKQKDLITPKDIYLSLKGDG